MLILSYDQSPTTLLCVSYFISVIIIIVDIVVVINRVALIHFSEVMTSQQERDAYIYYY